MSEWLSVGVDGISLSLSGPYELAGAVSLRNLTTAIRDMMWKQRAEERDNRKTCVAMIAESKL